MPEPKSVLDIGPFLHVDRERSLAGPDRQLFVDKGNWCWSWLLLGYRGQLYRQVESFGASSTSCSISAESTGHLHLHCFLAWTGKPAVGNHQCYSMPSLALTWLPRCRLSLEITFQKRNFLHGALWPEVLLPASACQGSWYPSLWKWLPSSLV